MGASAGAVGAAGAAIIVSVTGVLVKLAHPLSVIASAQYVAVPTVFKVAVPGGTTSPPVSCVYQIKPIAGGSTEIAVSASNVCIGNCSHSVISPELIGAVTCCTSTLKVHTSGGKVVPLPNVKVAVYVT